MPYYVKCSLITILLPSEIHLSLSLHSLGSIQATRPYISTAIAFCMICIRVLHVSMIHPISTVLHTHHALCAISFIGLVCQHLHFCIKTTSALYHTAYCCKARIIIWIIISASYSLFHESNNDGLPNRPSNRRAMIFTAVSLNGHIVFTGDEATSADLGSTCSSWRISCWVEPKRKRAHAHGVFARSV